MTGATIALHAPQWPVRPISELVAGPAITVDSDASLRTASDTMARLGIGLVGVASDGQIVGVLSARDIVWAVAENMDLDAVDVSAVMTPRPTSVPHHVSLGDAVIAMAIGSHRHLVVDFVDGAGIVSASEILSDIAMELAQTPARPRTEAAPSNGASNYPTSEQRIVLIGDDPLIAGTERIMAAFRDGDQLIVPIEVERPSNRHILAATTLYVHDDQGTTRWRPIVRRVPTTMERRDLDDARPGALGEQIEFLYLGDPSPVDIDDEAASSTGARTLQRAEA